MWSKVADYEVRVKGYSLIRINNGEVSINGKDFHTDLKTIALLIDMLTEVLHQAEETKQLRLVSTSSAAIKQSTNNDNGDKPFPKVIKR